MFLLIFLKDEFALSFHRQQLQMQSSVRIATLRIVHIAWAGSRALLWPIELLETALLSIVSANGIAAWLFPFHHFANNCDWKEKILIQST